MCLCFSLRIFGKYWLLCEILKIKIEFSLEHKLWTIKKKEIACNFFVFWWIFMKISIKHSQWVELKEIIIIFNNIQCYMWTICV